MSAMVASARPRRLFAGLMAVALLVTSFSFATPVRAAAFVVNSTSDSVDINPGDGVCANSAGRCTIRAAVMEANTLPGADTISIPAGTYTLRIAPGADDPATGDFDVFGPLTITGAGATTILDGGDPPIGAPPNVLAIDRLFQIHPTAGNVTIGRLTIQGGWSAASGGGIANASPGTLRLESVTVRDNASEVEGGGIFHDAGRLILTGTVAAPSLVADNRARGGGGLHSTGLMSPVFVPTRVEISRTTFSGNVASAGGGGVEVVLEGTLSVADSAFANNSTAGDGGGISATSKSSFTVTRSSFSNNSADGSGGGLYSATEGSASISSATFTGNRAGDTTGGEGGGLYAGGMGSVQVAGSGFSGNSATGNGGGIAIDNGGSVGVSDTAVRDNRAGAGGGGIFNAGANATFTRVQATGNTAVGDGGGLLSEATGNFTINDSSFNGNTAENGGGFANAGDGGLRVSRSTFWNNRALSGVNSDTGLGGGIYSLGDAAAEYTNVTISGNLAQVRGGGLYVDADAGVRVINSTITLNQAPAASGVGDEGTAQPTNPPTPSLSVVFRNTIVAGNLGSAQCNYALGSQGGNLENGDSCFFRGPGDRANAAGSGLDAIADNGGPTLTHALRPGTIAIDGGVTPCPTTDQRGVSRPQNTRCDMGAFEFEGPFGPPDSTPPDTQYLSGPAQDSEATSRFTFTGSDNVTAPADLIFECRLLEFDPTEPPEPVDPTQPPGPELAFLPCANPWQVPLIEAGSWEFAVRAVDRAGNVDPTPALYTFTLTEDVTPPQTILLTTPANPSGSTVSFTFSGSDNATPAQFLEFECRLDSNDPAAWLECFNPALFANLTPGSHTFQVRAADTAGNIDPSPATFIWTVNAPASCDAANVTLFAVEDSSIDEGLPLDNFGFFESLTVRSAAPGNDARSLLRFVIPAELPDCALESATLRLFSEGDPGRTLQADLVAAPWSEMQVTWANQPATVGQPVNTTSGAGYRSWNVTAHVNALLGSTANYGWMIRDAAEEDATGAEQGFVSTEAVVDPPTPPELVLRFVGSGAPPPPAPVEPDQGELTTVTCGMMIEDSIRLANSLVNCPGEGLIVDASNIVIDLNGQTIDGTAVFGTGNETGGPAGIRISGQSNVVVRNGTIREFYYGVRITAASAFNVVDGVAFTRNINAGVELFDGDDGRNGNTVRNSRFVDNEMGVTVYGNTENAAILNSYFAGNVGSAIEAIDGSGVRIEDNEITGIPVDPTLGSDQGIVLQGHPGARILRNRLGNIGDAGIVVSLGSDRALVEGNTLSRAGDAAIGVTDSDFVRVINNVANLSSDAGISFDTANDGIITGNDVRYNPGGIELGAASRTLVANNNASFAGGTGIGLSADSFDNRIIGNTANSTGADGIGLEVDATDAIGNLVEGNTTHGNRGDGINIFGANHTLRNNDADNNAGYGISADDGNIDGGGNTAQGNGRPTQCVGVVCADGAAPPADVADVVAPETFVTSGPADGTTVDQPATLVFGATDNQALATALTFECRLNPPADPEVGWTECASPQTYTFLVPGPQRFEVRARDPNDNIDLSPATFTWTAAPSPFGADTLAPSVRISEAPASGTTSTTATFRFAGSDNLTPGPSLTYECAIDGGVFAACVSPASFAGLAVGQRSFAVRAVDERGNRTDPPAVHTWTIAAPPVDTAPPDTTIDGAPDPTTVSDSASFSFSSNESGVSFECSLDGGAFEPCTSPRAYTLLAVGEHTFRVRAVDGAGNVDPTPASFTWEVTPALVPTLVACGQTVTQSILVLNSLTNCPQDGLLVGADRITIDLNGNTIDGISIGYGILNNGFDDVTIRNGTIQEFDFGVQLQPETRRNLVAGLELLLNQDAGVSLLGVLDSSVRDSSFAGNGDSIQLLDGSARNLVRNNDIGGSVGLGLALINTTANRIEENSIAGSGDQGVELLGATFNRLTGNRISGSSDTAFAVEEGSNDSYIAGNTVTGSEAGINVSDSSRLTLIDNRVSGSSDNGISLDNVQNSLIRNNDLRFNTGGLSIDGSADNRIEGNNLSNITGFGLEMGEENFRNLIIGNIANDNTDDGLSIGGSAPAGDGNIIEGNEANGNGSDGIVIGGANHVVLRNEANGNAAWGIYAMTPGVEGFVVDGGFNSAQGNGEPLQCNNIRCDGGPADPLDTQAPETTIESSPSNPTFFTRATFQFAGQDNATGVRFECALDGAPFAACTSPVTYSGLALGSHTFQVRAIDFLRNVDQTPASWTWVIQTPPVGVPPETFIQSGPDATTPSTTATFTLARNEEEVTFECSLDGGAFEPCSTPVTFSGLGAGARLLEVRAVDGGGLADPTPARYTWTVTPAPVATTVGCGQVILQSIRLANNLTDCNGNGLIVGASNITIDLGGRTIDGINLGVGIINNGFDNVVITNGIIQEFDYAVQLNAGTASNIVANLTAIGNQDGGIQLANADQAGVGNTVRNNRVEGSINGVALIDGTTAARVRDNTLTALADNGIYLLNSSGNTVEANTIFEISGAGVALESANDNLVLRNSVTDASGGGVSVGAELLPANRNRVEGNRITGGGSDAIVVTQSSQNEIVANIVRDAPGGISLDRASNTLIQRNDIRASSGGVDLIGSSGNRIEQNILIDSGGIRLEALSLSNVIVQNEVATASGEGIYIGDPAAPNRGNRIDFNVVTSSNGGIFVNASGHTIGNNAANLNSGWGIYAVPGNVDGGGNSATGNAEPQQCFNIVCTIGAPPGAPDTTIVQRPLNPSNSRSALFTFTGSDNNTPTADLGFECRLDSTSELAWVECANPQEYTALSPGEHVFEVRAIDADGLADPTPARYEWQYVALPGGVAPDTFINLRPEPVTPLLDAIFTFSANEPDVTFQCSLDNAPFTPCEFAVEYSFEPFELGAHTFRVRAIDFEGNVDPTPASYTWVIGGILTTITGGPAFIPPAAPGEPAEGGETTATTATFTFESNVADATFFCSLDLGAFVACNAGTISYSNLAVGEHIFRVYAVDPEGNEQLEPTEYSWTVLATDDVTPPTAQILTTPASNSSNVVFTFTGQDNVTVPTGLSFECSLDGISYAACASPLNLYTLFAAAFAPGPNTFYLQATDIAGNTSAPVSYSWTAAPDTVAPVARIDRVPPSPTAATEATFLFSATDNATPVELLAFECAVGAEPFAPCASPETVTVEPGNVTFRVRAVDLAQNPSIAAGYDWVVVGEPDTTIAGGPATPTSETTATFTFSSNQSPVTFECALNGGAFAACPTPYTLSGLGGGSYALDVRAVNSFGLADSTPAEFNWLVESGPDSTPPDTTIVTGPPAVITASQASFTFTASELSSTFQCQLSRDGVVVTPFTDCTTPYAIQNLLGGAYLFEVRAIDPAGNADPSPAGRGFTVSGPPTTTITATPLDPTEIRTATFEFVSNVPNSTFQCSLDGAAPTPCTSPITYNNLAFGPHNFFVFATAPGGFVDENGAEYDWTIQEIQTTLTAGPPSVTQETSATFNFTASIVGSTFACRLDPATPDAPWEPCAGPITFTGLAVGEHTFQVRATSPAGITDTTPASFGWEIEGVAPPDVTPPTTTIITRPAASTADTTAVFTFTANEVNVVFECSLDGQPFNTCISPVEYNGLTVGPHSFEVRARDLAGNVDPTPDSYSWVITTPPDPVEDTTPPDTTITAGPSGQNGNIVASFEFTGSDNLTLVDALAFECRLDSSDPLDWAGCTSPELTAELAFGEHTFEVRAVDEAGNVDPTPATRTWTVVDLIAPDTLILTTPEDVTAETTAGFTFAADPAGEPGTTFECSLDNADFAPCASGLTLSNLSVGSHTFQVSAVDAAGNRDSTPDLFTWVVVGPSAPVASIAGGPPSPIDSVTEVFFSFETDLPAAVIDGFECSLNGQGFSSCDNPADLGTLSVGNYTLSVQAIDLLGRTGPASAPYAWTVVTAVDPNANTPAGTNVTVIAETPSGATTATLTFATVTTAGNTTVSDLAGAPALPANFQAGAVTYDISTTALFSGQITVCVSYDSSLYAENALNTIRLLHFVNGAWTDVTTFNNLTAEEICGRVTSLSPFAVVVPTTSLLPTATPTASPTGAPTATGTATTVPTATGTPTGTPTSAPTAEATATSTATSAPTAEATATSTATSAPTAEATATNTATTEPTATSTATTEPTVAPTATSTATTEPTVAPTAEATATSTATTEPTVAPTAEATATSTATTEPTVAPTATSTATTEPTVAPTVEVTATSTATTESTVAPTAEATATSTATTEPTVAPTATSTATTEPTSTNTPAPTATNTATATSAPTATSTATTEPTSTNTPAPTATSTATTAPTSTNTPAPTATNTATATSAPTATATSAPTATSTATTAPTSTNTPAPTATNTATPPPACTVTTVTYQANADAWLEQNSPGNNKGGDSINNVKSQGATDNFRTVVRFNLPASVPTGCAVQSATLRMYSASGVNGRTLEALRLGAAWGEATITWANQPATTGGAATAQSSSSATWREWTVTGQVQSIFTSGANNGFLIRDAAEGGTGAQQQFHSRENGNNRPVLVVTYTQAGTVPPPTSTTAPTLTPTAAATSTPTATAAATSTPTATAAATSTPTATAAATSTPTAAPSATATTAATSTPTSTPTTAPTATSTPAPVACAVTTATYQANADAWFAQNSPGSNNGTDSNLKVQGKSPSDNYRAVVRFNLPASVPAGCQVQSATLRLNASSAAGGRTLQALRLAGTWTEGGVTWSNQPATTGTAATTSSGTGWREWTVTGQVQAIFAAGANHGFLIRDANESSGSAEQQFRSREAGSNRPVLVVTYAQATTGGSGTTLASAASMPATEAGDPGAPATLAAPPNRVAARVSLSDLSGPAGVVPAGAVELRLNGATPGDARGRVAVTLAPGATAPVGRYTGLVMITWRDVASGARTTETVPVELAVGGYRVHLPVLRR